MEEAGSGGGGSRTLGEMAAVAGVGRRTHSDGEIQNGFVCTSPRLCLIYMDDNF